MTNTKTCRRDRGKYLKDLLSQPRKVQAQSCNTPSTPESLQSNNHNTLQEHECTPLSKAILERVFRFASHTFTLSLVKSYNSSTRTQSHWEARQIYFAGGNIPDIKLTGKMYEARDWDVLPKFPYNCWSTIPRVSGLKLKEHQLIIM